MNDWDNRKKDERLLIDSELAIQKKDYSKKELKNERLIAKRLGLKYQTYFKIKKNKIEII